MARHSDPQVEAPGQDSFLDVVTNLVGILIILVMVLGTRATHEMVQHDKPEPAETERPPTVDLAAAQAAKQNVEQQIHATDARLQRQLFENNYRRNERDKFLGLVTAAERELEQRRQKLDATQRTQWDLQRDLRAAQREWDDLKASRKTIENSVAPANVIEHMPTPMAKTVFGHEVHFRLQGGRLAYVPWDELVTALKNEAPQRLWKLKDSTSVTEVIGPVRGFRMKYTLRRGTQAVQVGRSVATQERIELDRFVLLPIAETLGEPVSAALKENSEFRAVLADHDPNRTTVTVWVYPDSFGQFREVKSDLFRRGYLTAGRPMPEGHPIGGSPDGTRSAAE